MSSNLINDLRRTKRAVVQQPTRLLFLPSGLVLMDGAASDDEEISALGASPARPRAGGSAASSPTLSLPESFSNLGGEPAPLARLLVSERVSHTSELYH